MEEAKQNTEEPSENEGYPQQLYYGGPIMPNVTGEQQAAAAAPPAENGSRELVVLPTNNSSNGTGGAAPAERAETVAEEEKEEPSGVMHSTQPDLYFLIANFLTHASPCSQAAQVLKREMVRDPSFSVFGVWKGHMVFCFFSKHTYTRNCIKPVRGTSYCTDYTQGAVGFAV